MEGAWLSPRHNDSLAPARSALAGLWLRRMEPSLLLSVSHDETVAVATANLSPLSKRLKSDPMGEGEAAPALK